MSQLFLLPGSARRDPFVDAWLQQHRGELGGIAKHWFNAMRRCGRDVQECLHDGHATACVNDAAFGYVAVFKDHVNVGFFRGAEISDPERILLGTGKSMRHVKLGPKHPCDPAALSRLVAAAYADMRTRVKGGSVTSST